MDAHKIVETDIQAYIRKAMKAGILVNPRMSGDFFKRPNIISSKYTRFTDETDYLEQYSHKYENGEYFVALNDGAFFSNTLRVPSSKKKHGLPRKDELMLLASCK